MVGKFGAPALAAAALGLSACVSVFEGTSQELSVATSPSGASCAFEREGKSLGVIPSTPGTLVVKKSKYDITIRCNKPGYQEASYINHSGTSSTIAANVVVDILLTAGISSIVDSANGADNWYTPAVNITLIEAGGATVTGSTPDGADTAKLTPVSAEPVREPPK